MSARHCLKNRYAYRDIVLLFFQQRVDNSTVIIIASEVSFVDVVLVVGAQFLDENKSIKPYLYVCLIDFNLIIYYTAISVKNPFKDSSHTTEVVDK